MLLQYIRSFIFSYVAVPVLTLSVCVFGIPFLFAQRKTFMKVIKFWIRSESFLERIILDLHYEVRGLEHLPKDGPFIVAGKHQSTYETFKIHELFADPAIILKQELLSIPLWGQYLQKSGPIAIDRSSPTKATKSIQDGAITVKDEERPIVIFPQGTRVKPGISSDEMRYKPGVARIQEATNLPIIPMAINSGVFWPKGAFLKRSGTVVFEFLPAIEPGLDRKDLLQKIENVLETESTKLELEAKKQLQLT